MAKGTLLNGSIPGSKPLPLTSHFGRTPVAAQVEQAGGDRVSSPAPLRSCVACNAAPATHIVSLANEPKVPTGILPNLCLTCACVRAEEKQIARLTADANRASGLKAPLAKCAGCKRGVLDPFTGKGQKWHRACWFKSDEWRSMPQSEPEEGSPLAGLIGVGR